MCCGADSGPERGKEGETKFGFVIGDEVEVIKDKDFTGWGGHVRAFKQYTVAVNLDKPPEGERSNGQWFFPDELKKVV